MAEKRTYRPRGAFSPTKFNSQTSRPPCLPSLFGLEDPGFIRFVLLREHMASSPWLSAATDAEEEELPEDEGTAVGLRLALSTMGP